MNHYTVFINDTYVLDIQASSERKAWKEWGRIYKLLVFRKGIEGKVFIVKQ